MPIGPVVTQAEIEQGLRALGLGPGETVFFHSALSSFGYVVNGADAVIDAVLAVVGPTGTVVVPTFVLADRVGEFGTWWQPATTPSSAGLITEVFRHRPASRRSDHPIHSVAAIGPAAEQLTRRPGGRGVRLSPWQGSFDVGSPFDYLHEHNARYLLLGVTFTVQTLCHYVETLFVERCLQRARAVDPDQAARRQREVAQVFRAGGVWPHFDRARMGEYLESIGLWRQTRVGQANLRLADTRPYVAAALQALEAAPMAWFGEAFLAWYATVPGTPAGDFVPALPRVLADPVVPPARPQTGMKRVPAGWFSQGSLSTDPDVEPDERPQRLVYLDDYCIDRYPVTNAEYAAFVVATGHQPPPNWLGGRLPGELARRPVTYVAWDDARAYAAWVGKRLPTEAEWEKAARGGLFVRDEADLNPLPGRRYPWGDQFDRHRCVTVESLGLPSTAVGQCSPGGDSPYGVADLAGLVWEWVADWYDPTYYRDGPVCNPRGPTTGQQKVVRGGEAGSRGRYARCASRAALGPTGRFSVYGFRCAWTPGGPEPTG